jgi:hypothetical protein
MNITKVIILRSVKAGLMAGHFIKENILPIVVGMITIGLLAFVVKLELRIIQFFWNLI